MIEIFLLTFLCVSNAFRAKARGLKTLTWALYTVLGVFGGMFIAAMVIGLNWFRQYGQLTQEKMMAMMESGELAFNEWNQWFIIIWTFGGYLFVRYRIEKHPKLKNDGQDNSPS